MPYITCSGTGLPVRVLGDVVHEAEEVVGLPVEAQRVQAPQREGGVAHPRVAVVPVTFAARGFRQRGGRGRHQGAGRRVGQALERERAALQVAAPRMVGELADGDPLPPTLGGLPHLRRGLVPRFRCRQLRPRQRDVHLVALHHAGAGARLAALEAEAQVGGELERSDRTRLRGRRWRSPPRRPCRCTASGPPRGGSRRRVRSSPRVRRPR